MLFLNAYSITRHYGGAEEGGWWYNWYECIEVFPVRDEEQGEKLKQWLFEQHKHRKHGDIYSVLGGEDIRVYLEEKPKESQTIERPYYE